jgi:hypothetical protein
MLAKSTVAEVNRVRGILDMHDAFLASIRSECSVDAGRVADECEAVLKRLRLSLDEFEKTEKTSCLRTALKQVGEVRQLLDTIEDLTLKDALKKRVKKVFSIS